MNEVLKQRLVGALILVALGVVFWPIIFVEPEGERSVQERTMPSRPNVDTSPVAVPDVAGLRPSAELPAREEALAAGDGQAEPAGLPERPAIPVQAPEPDPDPEPEPAAEPAEAEPAAQAPAPVPEKPRTTRSEAPEKPTLDEDGVPVAWMLQVASLSSETRARDLKNQLLAIDQEAYVKRIRRGDKTLWRVYIGPKFEKARLEAVQPQVDRAVGVTSKIMRYYP